MAATMKLLTKISVADPPSCPLLLLSNQLPANTATGRTSALADVKGFDATAHDEHWRAGFERWFGLKTTGNWSPIFFLLYLPYMNDSCFAGKIKRKRTVARTGYKNLQIWIWYRVKKGKRNRPDNFKGKSRATGNPSNQPGQSGVTMMEQNSWWHC